MELIKKLFSIVSLVVIVIIFLVSLGLIDSCQFELGISLLALALMMSYLFRNSFKWMNKGIESLMNKIFGNQD